MSFSKAKLKRFNDIDICDSPSTAATGATSASATTSSSSTTHSERKEQIEKFFKEAVKANGASASAKEPKEAKEKEKSSFKSKGLRLFRTPSLPHRLRFRQHSDLAPTASSSTAASTPLHSTASTPIKEFPKSASNLKGKEALQFEIRSKNELLESYMSQIDVLKRHVDQLKETEVRLKEDHAQVIQRNDTLINELITENVGYKNAIDSMSSENTNLLQKCNNFELDLKNLTESHSSALEHLRTVNSELELKCCQLNTQYEQQLEENLTLNEKIEHMNTEICELKENLHRSEEKHNQSLKEIRTVEQKNADVLAELSKLKAQVEADALVYAAETNRNFVEMESLKNEKNALKNDLINKTELIKNLQEELLDKNCEIDCHCDTIRKLEEEKRQFSNSQHSIENAEEKVRIAEIQAEQKIKELELNLEQTVERERNYWRSEITRRQHQAENQVIKIELEKQDVMVLLESTNDMLRERDEKIQKYEDQLRRGLDYYIQLTDNLQKQVVDLKADIAKTITEKYNYQLTLNNTRSTVNILMERLKKSDSDVETLKTELETLQNSKTQLEANYNELQNEVTSLKNDLAESETTLNALRESSTALQNEVRAKETMFSAILTSEEETLGKFNKIATNFQERVDENIDKYLELYMDLKNKDEDREVYMADMRKALDEFATVLELAQLEIDNKDKCLSKLREENESLKMDNISLKSKATESSKCIAEKDTDDMLIDTQLRAECDKITNWLLSSSDDSNDVKDILKEKLTGTPKSLPRTPRPCQNHTPKTPRTPKTPCSPKTPKSLKTALFGGKENLVAGMDVIKSPLKTINK